MYTKKCPNFAMFKNALICMIFVVAVETFAHQRLRTPRSSFLQKEFKNYLTNYFIGPIMWAIGLEEADRHTHIFTFVG